jgi:hypothetical protein
MGEQESGVTQTQQPSWITLTAPWQSGRTP